jgi:solute carrier family 39 (zinc transporter), member 7
VLLSIYLHSGWLNIIADMMHNFTDGIALGVVFQSNNPTLAVATTVSVFIHEIPHELGDFAILIESGLRSVWLVS